MNNIQFNGPSGLFFISLLPPIFLFQAPAQRSKSSKPVCVRAWYAPSPSLSSSASCSSRPIRCCEAAWNRSCGIFCGLNLHLKATIATRKMTEETELQKKPKLNDNNKKNRSNRQKHSCKTENRWLQRNWSHQGHNTCRGLSWWQRQTDGFKNNRTTGPHLRRQLCVYSGQLTIHINLRNKQPWVFISYVHWAVLHIFWWQL